MKLHANIINTSESLGDLKVCHARLQTEAHYPWIVLIPHSIDAYELDDVPAPQRAIVMEEIILAGEAVRKIGVATGVIVEKINIGSLGNATPQLHIHVVGRRKDDALWPMPVWGRPAGEAYTPELLSRALSVGREALGL